MCGRRVVSRKGKKFYFSRYRGKKKKPLFMKNLVRSCTLLPFLSLRLFLRADDDEMKKGVGE